jgi:chemotaxis protein MotB
LRAEFSLLFAFLKIRTMVWLAIFAAAVSSGCGRVVFTPTQQQAQPITLTPQQQQLLAQTQQQMQQRAASLDSDNQELETLLAQSRQQAELLREQVLATQDQLKATTDRLATAERESAEFKNRTQTLMASTQQAAPGEFRPNNTLLRPLAVTNMPGVSAQQDGDTIRVRVAGDALFQQGSPRLQPGADALLRRVAADLMANYPEHIIGIEGHTSLNEPLSPQFPTPHHLSTAQATAVFDVLRQTMGTSAGQLFVLGHGGNHPIASNGEDEGRKANRRIELVVYPETIRRR